MEKVPLSPMKKGSEEHVDMEPASAWRLRYSNFRMPERPQEQPLVTRVFKRGHGMYLIYLVVFFLPSLILHFLGF